MAEKLTDRQAIQMIMERAKELSERPDVKEKGFEIAKTKGMDAAKDFVYRLAIATLYGI